MKPTYLTILACAGALMLNLGTKCFGQFPGDLFFRVPSVTAAEDGTVEMDVQFFAGAGAFGAAMFDVVFNPSELRIEGVVLRPGNQSPTIAYELAGEGRVSVAVFNDGSLVGPIGTIEFATLVVRPLIGVGQSTSIVLHPREALLTHGGSFPIRGSFGGTIVVLAPFPLAADEPLDVMEFAGPLVAKDPVGGGDFYLLRAGGVLDLWVPGDGGDQAGGGTWKRIRARTYDPNAPVDVIHRRGNVARSANRPFAR